jgi:hypothetical protein
MIGAIPSKSKVKVVFKIDQFPRYKGIASPRIIHMIPRALACIINSIFAKPWPVIRRRIILAHCVYRIGREDRVLTQSGK